MSILSGVSEFFGLDIGTTAIRLVQLKGNGPIKSLVKYAYVPIPLKESQDSSEVDNLLIQKTIKDLVSKANLSTKNVAVGIPSQKVFTTVVEVDKLSLSDLSKSIKFQAEPLIPTPIAESKIDWSVIGESQNDKTKIELLLSSVPNSATEPTLAMLEGIGLNVIAFEPDNLAISRALIDPNSAKPIMVFDMGTNNSDLVISMNNAAMLTRSITFGTNTLVKSAMQNLNIKSEQAEEVIFKFGLNMIKAEGQVYQAIINAADTLTSEIDKSIKFFSSKYPNIKLDKIVIAGAAAIIPDFPLFLANHTQINVEIGNSWRNISYPPTSEEQLSKISNQFGVAAGLAERQE
jgi:type IV pilus assembly protein PilM